MEEPGGRFAHGFFRRTGDAGSVTARGGDRKVSGGLDPIPSQRHTAWASRHTHLRIGTRTGPCLLPHCDASRARPSSGADLAQGYSRGWDCCQEQSENITLPSRSAHTPRRHGRPCAGHPDADKRGASDDRDHRHEAGDDVRGWHERPCHSRPEMAQPSEGKGIHPRAQRHGSPPRSLRIAGDDVSGAFDNLTPSAASDRARPAASRSRRGCLPSQHATGRGRRRAPGRRCRRRGSPASRRM